MVIDYVDIYNDFLPVNKDYKRRLFYKNWI